MLNINITPEYAVVIRDVKKLHTGHSTINDKCYIQFYIGSSEVKLHYDYKNFK